MRVDFSIQCMDADGKTTSDYAVIQMFTIIMLIIHTFGTPATYAYLFFKKYNKELKELKRMAVENSLNDQLKYNGKSLGYEQINARQEANDKKDENLRFAAKNGKELGVQIPGYLQKLTGGYEYRTFWCVTHASNPRRSHGMQPPISARRAFGSRPQV